MKTLLWLVALVGLSAAMAWWLGSGGQSPALSELAAAKPVPEAQHPQSRNATLPPASMPVAPTTTGDLNDHSPGDVAAECRRILETGSPAQRQLAFAQLLARTRDQAGLRAILDVFDQFYKQGKRHGAEWFTFWSELVDRDPAAAAALSQSYNKDPKWQAGVAGMIAHEWAAKDPEAAIAWLAANTSLSAADLDKATLGLIAGYASRDAKAATAYALSVIAQDDPLFGDMAFALSTTAMQQGGEEGLFAWFDALPDDALKHRLFPSVSNRLERTSIEARAAWLASQAASPYRNDLAYRDFVGAWAKEDPASAMAWVFNLPPSPRDGTMVGVGYAAFPWLENDPQGFTRYFHTLSQAHQQEVVRTIQLITADPKFPERKRQPGLAFLESLK